MATHRTLSSNLARQANLRGPPVLSSPSPAPSLPSSSASSSPLPQPAVGSSGKGPDRAALEQTADAQLDSAFFSRLPREVRELIYVEFWRASGHGALRQHVTTRRTMREWTHVPCVIDQELGDDERAARWIAARAAASAPAAPTWVGPPAEVDQGALEPEEREARRQHAEGEELPAWQRRLKGEWGLHWRCYEEGGVEQWEKQPARGNARRPPTTAGGGESSSTTASLRQARSSLFLPILLGCRRLYLEAIESIANHVTFVFTDISVALAFLSKWPYTPSIRSLQLGIRLMPFLTEMYFPAPQGPPPSWPGRPHVTMANNIWEQLCAVLAKDMPQLRRLHVWLDTKDLRAWHKRVDEKSFFRSLFKVRLASKHAFVLALPNLPPEGRPRGLPNAYLEGDEVLADAPFTVVRGDRPNNWQVHLASLNGMLERRNPSLAFPTPHSSNVAEGMVPPPP